MLERGKREEKERKNKSIFEQALFVGEARIDLALEGRFFFFLFFALPLLFLLMIKKTDYLSKSLFHFGTKGPKRGCRGYLAGVFLFKFVSLLFHLFLFSFFFTPDSFNKYNKPVICYW